MLHNLLAAILLAPFGMCRSTRTDFFNEASWSREQPTVCVFGVGGDEVIMRTVELLVGRGTVGRGTSLCIRVMCALRPREEKTRDEPVQ